MSATLGRKRVISAGDAQLLADVRAQAASPGDVMRLTPPRPRRWSPRERHGVNARTRLVTTLVLLVALLSAAPGTSLARGSSYVFDGGTAAQQRQVDRALAVSTFPWNKVPATITIHIDRGSRSEALPGHIWLDADLLDSGQYSWGTIQHEYAHQVDFSFSQTPRARDSCEPWADETGATPSRIFHTGSTAANASPRRSPGPTGPPARTRCGLSRRATSPPRCGHRRSGR
jgi:hypothetical protein